MDLQALAQFAVKNNNTNGSRKPIHTLTMDEARAYVTVRDGNKKPNEDGSQALTLGFGKHTLPLDVIAEGTTRVNASAEQVEDFSKALLDAVAAGSFDEAILAAQAKAEVQFNTPRKPRAPKVVEGEVPEAVNLDALDEMESEEEGFDTIE